MTNANTTHPGNNLDLLRLLFASLVLLSHAPEMLDGNRGRELLSIATNNAMTFGGFAVAGFFVLSGYLIVASWTQQPKLIPFFRNRVLRIYPAFIVAFCISVLIIGPVGAGSEPYFNQFGPIRFVYAMLTLRDPSFAHSFFGQHYLEINGAMWTISYEFLCYASVAAVGAIAGRRMKFVWLALTLVLLVAACFVQELESLPQHGRFRIAALVYLGSLFFAGGSLRLLGFRGLRSSWLIAAFCILFCVSTLSQRFNVTGFAVFGSVFFLSIGLKYPKLKATRTWPDISYGTYLYGWPILQLIIWWLPGLGPWSVFAIALVFSLACGYLSWTFVEAPFMRLKKKASQPLTAGLRAD